jgi:hypothetical protein
LADLVQPVLKVLIETGYDRTSYGTPSPFGLLPLLNPVEVGVDLVEATAQGITDAVGDITGTRPAGPPTQDPFATAASLLSGQDVLSGQDGDDQTVPAPSAAPDTVAGKPVTTSSGKPVTTSSGKPVAPGPTATPVGDRHSRGVASGHDDPPNKRPATTRAGAKPASDAGAKPTKRLPPRR